MYGPFGYSDGNDAASQIVRITGSYVCTVGGAPCADDKERGVAANWGYSAGAGFLDDWP